MDFQWFPINGEFEDYGQTVRKDFARNEGNAGFPEFPQQSEVKELDAETFAHPVFLAALRLVFIPLFAEDQVDPGRKGDGPKELGLGG
jgi:hypothetical protein